MSANGGCAILSDLLIQPPECPAVRGERRNRPSFAPPCRSGQTSRSNGSLPARDHTNTHIGQQPASPRLTGTNKNQQTHTRPRVLTLNRGRECRSGHLHSLQYTRAEELDAPLLERGVFLSHAATCSFFARMSCLDRQEAHHVLVIDHECFRGYVMMLLSMLFHGYVIACDQHVDELAECRLFDIQRLNVFSRGGDCFWRRRRSINAQRVSFSMHFASVLNRLSRSFGKDVNTGWSFACVTASVARSFVAMEYSTCFGLHFFFSAAPMRTSLLRFSSAHVRLILSRWAMSAILEWPSRKRS